MGETHRVVTGFDEWRDLAKRDPAAFELKRRARQALPKAHQYNQFLANIERARRGDTNLPDLDLAKPQVFDPTVKTKERRLFRAGQRLMEQAEETFPVTPERARF